MNDQKKIDGNDLHFFPKYATDIEVKEKNYEKIVRKNLAILELDKEIYKKHSSFGDYILEYGKSLLKNGFLLKAGLILSRVCGSENWDNQFPYALLEKARIAAILGEKDFLFEFLRWTFATEAYFKDSVGGKKAELKRMATTDPESEKYRDLPRFKQIVDYIFTEKELDMFYDEIDRFV